MPFVEDVVEFETWMDKMLKDAKEKLTFMGRCDIIMAC